MKWKKKIIGFLCLIGVTILWVGSSLFIQVYKIFFYFKKKIKF